MQRWIAAGLAVIVVLAAGGWAAYSYKQNKPNPIWVPLPLNPELPETNRQAMATQLNERLHERPLLEAVSNDLGLGRQWNLGSDANAATELGNRLFVKVGEVPTNLGSGPALHIGLTGKRKERQLTEQIVMRVMQDVWKILGIKPPPNKPR